MTETFNFTTRDTSAWVLDRLNAFIAANKGCDTPSAHHLPEGNTRFMRDYNPTVGLRRGHDTQYLIS